MIENASPDDFVILTLSNSRQVVGVLMYEGVDGFVLQHPHYVKLDVSQGAQNAIMQLFEYCPLSDEIETKILPGHVVSVNMLSEHYVKMFTDAINGMIGDATPEDIPSGNNGPLH